MQLPSLSPRDAVLVALEKKREDTAFPKAAQVILMTWSKSTLYKKDKKGSH